MRKRAQWRELLDSLIQTRSDRDRIATEMGINPVTLTRWASGDSTPRSHSLHLLLTALPVDCREQFQALIEQDLPFLSFEQPFSDSFSHEIPFPFINTVMTTRATGTASNISWVIVHQVLQHALLQLDPLHLGLKITLVHCMPPTSDGKIHSLREGVGLGTAPWKESLEEHALFLGLETLVGYCVETLRYQEVPDLRAHTSYFLPYYQAEYEVSAAACPILFLGQIAGCVLFSSTQPNYFGLEERNMLVQGYTNLISLAFREKDFYPPDLIELRIAPPPEEQQEHLMSFQPRVMKLMRESVGTSQYLSSAQAEQLAWQQIEAELLKLPFHTV
jgi:hypothetical protein